MTHSHIYIYFFLLYMYIYIYIYIYTTPSPTARRRVGEGEFLAASRDDDNGNINKVSAMPFTDGGDADNGRNTPTPPQLSMTSSPTSSGTKPLTPQLSMTSSAKSVAPHVALDSTGTGLHKITQAPTDPTTSSPTARCCVGEGEFLAASRDDDNGNINKVSAMPNIDGGVADNGIDHEANQRLVPLLRTDARQESLHARIRIARDIYIYI